MGAILGAKVVTTVLCIPLFQHSIIPRGSLSLKVLAELPIIVVLMYQVCVFPVVSGFWASHFTALYTPALLWQIDVYVTRVPSNESQCFCYAKLVCCNQSEEA